jgi:anti-sigma B factor antagonist
MNQYIETAGNVQPGSIAAEPILVSCQPPFPAIRYQFMSVDKWSDSIVVIHLADDPQFTDELEDLERHCATAPRRPHAVLDFAGVVAINSSNLARLLKLRKQAIEAERRLILCKVGPHVLHTLLVTGLDNVFDLSQDVSTALATIQMQR